MSTYTLGWGEGGWGINGWSGIAPAYAVTGVSATGSVGAVLIQVTALPVGVQATGAVDNATPLVAPTITGVQASAAIGTIKAVPIRNVFPVGVEATGFVAPPDNYFLTHPVTGVHGTAEIGGFIVQVNDIVVPDTFPLFATGAVGTVDFAINYTTTGVQGTASVEPILVAVQPEFFGVEGTASVGTVATAVNSTVELTGLEATGAVNSDGFLIVYTPTGVLATANTSTVTPTVIHAHDSEEGFGAVGDVSFVINSNIAITGVEATGSVGDITARITFVVTGVQGIGAVGTVDIEVDDGVIVDGVYGIGAIGTVKFGGWTSVDDFQNPNWVPVDDAQNVLWEEIDVAA